MNENEFKILQFYSEVGEADIETVSTRFKDKISRIEVEKIVDLLNHLQFLKHVNGTNKLRIEPLGRNALKTETEKRSKAAEKEKLEEENLASSAKLSKWKLKTYWPLLILGIIVSIGAIILAILKLSASE